MSKRPAKMGSARQTTARIESQMNCGRRLLFVEDCVLDASTLVAVLAWLFSRRRSTMTVKIPSIIESGTCVMAKIPRNFHAAPITPVTASG